MSPYRFLKNHILCIGMMFFSLPIFSHATQTIKPSCISSIASTQAMPMVVSQQNIQIGDPIAMMITAALNQRYERNFYIQDIQHLRENSKYKLSFPFKSSLLEIKHVIQAMGYNANGFHFKGLASEVEQGDVGFLLDNRVYVTPVIVLMLAASETQRHILYGNGSICSMEKAQFEQYFADAKFLRLD